MYTFVSTFLSPGYTFVIAAQKISACSVHFRHYNTAICFTPSVHFLSSLQDRTFLPLQRALSSSQHSTFLLSVCSVHFHYYTAQPYLQCKRYVLQYSTFLPPVYTFEITIQQILFSSVYFLQYNTSHMRKKTYEWKMTAAILFHGTAQSSLNEHTIPP